MGNEIGSQLPQEYDNVYQSVAADSSILINAEHKSEEKEHKIIGKDAIITDRRTQWTKNWRRGSHASIGQMHMEWGDKCYVGTGTIISYDDKTKTGHILTCAHNVYDGDTKKYANKLWFSLKDKENKLLVRFEINNYYVYPPYLKMPSCSGGADIAICTFIYKDMEHQLKKYKQYTGYMGENALTACLWTSEIDTVFGQKDRTRFDSFSIVGYPGEKKGELWGQKIEEYGSSDAKGLKCTATLVTYSTVDTTGGQSGSPILCNVGDFGEEGGFTDKMICGVHTGGSSAQGINFGTRITTDIIEWITKCTGEQYKDKFDQGVWFLKRHC